MSGVNVDAAQGKRGVRRHMAVRFPHGRLMKRAYT
jgi:hypothetical protein